MNKFFSSFLSSFFILLMSSSVYSGGDELSVLQEELDMVLMKDPCFDQLETDIDEDDNITSVIRLKGEGSFNQGDEIMSSSNVKAIVESYDSEKNQLTYYQTAETGFRSFSIGDKLVGKGSNVLTIEEFVMDFVVPCSDLIVSIEEDPEQMIFVFADSEAAIQAKLAAKELMAEIEREMALAAFQQKLEDERAAAAAATQAYRDSLLEAELAAFEAQLEAELAAAEMMAEIEEEMARAAALEAFLQKLEDEKAAAAAATAAYRASLEDEVIGELVVEDEVIVVTEEAHEACKYALGLSDANIALFETALADGTLFNKGPQSSNGTEFGASRWDAYANCVSNYVNPF
jgi:hypothetical protein